jgi:hypothetical protein
LKKNYHNIGIEEKREFSAENWEKSQKIVIITSTPELPFVYFVFLMPGDRAAVWRPELN